MLFVCSNEGTIFQILDACKRLYIRVRMSSLYWYTEKITCKNIYAFRNNVPLLRSGVRFGIIPADFNVPLEFL
jgi:hypothetical protein